MGQCVRSALAVAVIVALVGASAFDQKPPEKRRAIRVHDRAQALRLCGRRPRGTDKFACMGLPGEGPHGQTVYRWVQVASMRGGVSMQDDWFAP